MNGWFGPWELLIVLAVVLLIFGPKRLPSLGRSLGQGARSFKDAITGRHKDGDEDDADEPAQLPAAPEQAPEPTPERETEKVS
jgi:sec-independent protein translocase protein TatA